MDNDLSSSKFIVNISQTEYKRFHSLANKFLTEMTLDIFKDSHIRDAIKKICGEIFSIQINKIKLLLNNFKIGIAAVDVPECSLMSDAENAIFGAGIVIGIFNQIGESSIDSVNSTPFTLHTASHESGKLLETTEYTPEAKLGFHNDGILSEHGIELPNHLMVYNLYIAYRQPGCFKWVPVTLLETTLNNIYEGINIRTRLTPYFHINKEGHAQKSELGIVEAPLSVTDCNGNKRFFLNGKVLNDDNDESVVEVVNNLKLSLEKNPHMISIEQKDRRAFYLNNIAGFHARDVFEDPTEGVNLTRVFLRSVDVNTVIYPSKILE